MAPLTCAKCGGRMKILSFIEDPEIVKKILKHLGLWEVKARPPPFLYIEHPLDDATPRASSPSFTLLFDLVLAVLVIGVSDGNIGVEGSLFKFLIIANRQGGLVDGLIYPYRHIILGTGNKIV